MPFLAPFVPALVGAAAGVGAAALTAHEQSKAADQATAAQQAADDKALAAQQGNLDRIAGLQQPYVNAGYSALDAILARYNLPASGSAPAGTPAAPGGSSAAPAGGAPPATAPAPGATPGSSVDWDTYLAQNPDVAENARQRIADGTATSAQQVAQEHYTSFGQGEGRALPMNPSAAYSGDAQGAPADPLNPTRPDAGPRPTYSTPTYARPDQPEFADRGTGPNADDYLGAGKFEADPGYAFRQSEALRQGNAAYGAKGLLKSGGAIKAAQDRSYNLADQAYNTWESQAAARLAADRGQFNTNRQTDYNIFAADRQNLNANFDTDRAVGLTQFNNDRSFDNTNYNTDTARTDANFNTDRNYAAGQDQTRVNNLFNLVGTGTSAAGATGAAGTNFANNASNIYANQGDTTAQGIYAKADAQGNAINAIGGAASNIFARYAPQPVASGGTMWGNSAGAPWDGTIPGIF